MMTQGTTSPSTSRAARCRVLLWDAMVDAMPSCKAPPAALLSGLRVEGCFDLYANRSHGFCCVRLKDAYFTVSRGFSLAGKGLQVGFNRGSPEASRAAQWCSELEIYGCDKYNPYSSRQASRKAFVAQAASSSTGCGCHGPLQPPGTGDANGLMTHIIMSPCCTHCLLLEACYPSPSILGSL